jgi:hypothetical protein
MHPPFGFALFYLRSVAPKSIKSSEIYWGAVPFVIIQVIMVTLIIVFPRLVSYGEDGRGGSGGAPQAPVELNINQVNENQTVAPVPSAPAAGDDKGKKEEDDLARTLRGDAPAAAPAPDAAAAKKEEDDLAKALSGAK